MEAAAAALRMKVLYLGMEAQEQIGNAFAQILKERPGALLVLADRLFLHNRVLIMDFAAKHRLPGVYANVELVRRWFEPMDRSCVYHDGPLLRR